MTTHDTPKQVGNFRVLPDGTVYFRHPVSGVLLKVRDKEQAALIAAKAAFTHTHEEP